MSSITNLPVNNQANLNFDEQLESFIYEISTFFDKDKIEAIARETNFVQRESKLNGLLFLSLLVFGASIEGNPSLEEYIGFLSVQLQSLGLYLSRPGLHQRINKEAVDFLSHVLGLAMNNTIPECFKIDVPLQFNSIQIWDSTAFQLPAGLAEVFVGHGGSSSPAGVKIQFGYELNRHECSYFVQSSKESDTSISDMIVNRTQPGDLILQDLGYFDVSIFEAIRLKEAYYLSRLKRDVRIYERHDNANNTFRSQSLLSLVQNNQFEDRIELDNIFIRSKRNVFTPVRLIIERLPNEAFEARLNKMQKEAQSRQRQLSEEAIALAEFNFYITNAPSNLLPANYCRSLYGIRWQIELIFKAWKSHLEIDKIHVKKRPERVLVTILAKLIFITLTSQMIRINTALFWNDSELEISYYRALSYFKNIGKKWFGFIITSNVNQIFNLLCYAMMFLRRLFKIPQHDRIYPLKMLQMLENTVLT